MVRAKIRRCRDCLAGTRRVAPYPGPRCATHHRARRSTLSSRRHEQHVTTVYGITAEQYAALLSAQDGRCYGCQRKPARKRLAVDHRHSDGVVRGLLCKTCNRDVLGHYRDDPAALRRMADYLENPPAFEIIGSIIVPNEIS